MKTSHLNYPDPREEGDEKQRTYDDYEFDQDIDEPWREMDDDEDNEDYYDD